MHGKTNYLIRKTTQLLDTRLKNNPVVALLGARQVGKSTLAKEYITKIKQLGHNAIYLDLELQSDLNKLQHAELFFEQYKNHFICLDEIQKAPNIFSTIKAIVDKDRQNGKFLILGSASRDLIQQSSETLAGRISYIEITPLDIQELLFNKSLDNINNNNHWIRGGYPGSILAPNLETSIQWREDYIRTFLERDIPQLGFNIPSMLLDRFWRILAHYHGQTINNSKFSETLGISLFKAKQYFDILQQTFVIRTLQPYENNIKKRLIKSPKVYIRDSGILHALLSIETIDNLFSNSIFGASYEGYIIENIINAMPRWQSYFYKTSNGAEIDLLMIKGSKKIAIEIKASKSPKVSRGFWESLEDIKPDNAFIIAPVDMTYPVSNNVFIINIIDFLTKQIKELN